MSWQLLWKAFLFALLGWPLAPADASAAIRFFRKRCASSSHVFFQPYCNHAQLQIVEYKIEQRYKDWQLLDPQKLLDPDYEKLRNWQVIDDFWADQTGIGSWEYRFTPIFSCQPLAAISKIEVYYRDSEKQEWTCFTESTGQSSATGQIPRSYTGETWLKMHVWFTAGKALCR